jgi:putative ABC transport system permease protein
MKENEICLTDKVAQLLDVKQGDTIKLIDSDDKEVDVKVSNIVENYIYHYAYMTPETYNNLFGKEYTTNMLFTKNKQLSDEQLDELSKNIMSADEVSGVSVLSTLTSQIDNMMNSLNYVVIVLIVSAGLLAFVVLYNLQNVNISERIRELATIKVLGFYDKEVYSYVTRETVLLTIIGIVLGLIGGYFLNSFILTTCEINILRFKAVITPMSYVFSVLITVGFSIIVNVATYFSLKRIDMIESLKSIE